MQVERCFFLGGGFKYFLFSPLFGEMIQFDSYFSNGLKPPSSFTFFLVDEVVFFMTETYQGTPCILAS